ncbi:MAG TPA: hypothetical protein VJ924_11915 [Alphaproteobacteria bacterium]|nr:hypothetical protein [Alphaproteobacteria bacterium]
MIDREAVYRALFDRLAGTSGVIRASRRLKHWTDVAPVDQPALFQVQKRETPRQDEGLPTRWRFAVDVYLYAHAGADAGAVPAATLNALIDAIEDALAPDPASGVQTLDGRVAHCWISGAIETDEGALGPQAVAIVPIEILVA